MTSIAIKPELSVNTVVALLVAGGALYLAWKIKNGVSDVADDLGNWWEGVDLNPFDKAGTIGQIFTPSVSYDTFEVAARKALAAKGRNIDNYVLYTAKSGEKLPPDSWSVTWQGKVFYYIPRSSVGTFGKWISI
jgi:hypothetical protein